MISRTAGYALATQWGARPFRWKTADGRLIAVTRMTKRHLRNTLRMLFRQADLLEMVAVSKMPDDAVDYVDVPTPSQTILAHDRACCGFALLVEWSRRGYADDEWLQGDRAYARQLGTITERLFRRAA